MRNIVILLASFLLYACGGNQPQKASTDLVNNPATADSSNGTDSQGVPVITFDESAHDFGNLTQGEVIEYAFIFKNTGKGDLIIAKTTTSCGCTVAEFPKEVIKPGGSSKIKIKFDSEGRIDRFQKEITVSANTHPTETIITIFGNILPKTEIKNQNH